MDPGIVKPLDAYWSKAVKLAKENSGDIEIVQRIFKNLLSVSKGDIAAWWLKLSPQGKQRYLDKYPGSKYAKKVRATRKKKVLTKEDKLLLSGIKEPEETLPEETLPEETLPEETLPEEVKGDSQTKDELEDPSDEQPNEEVATEDQKAPRSLKERLLGAWSKKRVGIVNTLKHHTKGLKLVKSVLAGEKVSDEQYAHAKGTATLAATLVLGAFATVAVLAIAPTFAGPIAALFLEDGSNSFSYSSEKPEDIAEEIADKMYDWIMSQNPEDLKKRLEDYNAK